MLAFIEFSINLFLLAAIVLASAFLGFMVARTQLRKQKTTISKLEMEMLQSHSEILQLQKELSDKENAQSKTPIFSIRDSAAESAQEKLPGERSSKKIVSGGSKTSS